MDIKTQQKENTFLPDLCSGVAIFVLVLVGQLLALALVLARYGLYDFSWEALGMVSMLTQWVILSSASTLCPMRTWLNKLSPAATVAISYIVILFYTAFVSVVGMWLVGSQQEHVVSSVLTNLTIAAIFAGVMLRYLYLQGELKRKGEAELSARIQALQSRIRPHFLFNSFNSIASLIAVKPQVAEDLVIDLSRLFRASLQAPQHIPIHEEIALCRSFAGIEQARLGERLNLEWELGPLPDSVTILNLLLQPLLENAIYHGIQPLTKGGTVHITIMVVKEDVVMKVSNPFLQGPDTAERDDRYAHLDAGHGNGIALSNIRSRLEAWYGRKAYLRVVKGEADFTVIVRYPLRGSVHMNEE